jgi:hypothetical protein
MNPLVLIAILVAVPILLLTVLRINAAIVFLSLCVGSVLVRFVGYDAQSFMGLFTANKTVSDTYVSLGLLLVPVVFTMLVMIGTARGKLRSVFNILPAIAVGVVWLMLAEPLFSPGLRGTMEGTSTWGQLQHAQSLVVGVSTLISLLFLWLQRPRSREEGKRRR